MAEWLKILIPVLLTAILAAIAGMLADINRIDSNQKASAVHIYRIDQNEIKIRELQEREK